MDTAIITGLISGAVTLAVCLINNYYQRKDSERKHSENIVLIAYRLEQLEKEVQKHNTIIERTYDLERRQDVSEDQIKVANHRIEDLEKGTA